MATPVQGKAISAKTLFVNVKQKIEEDEKEFKKLGGLCIRCRQEPADKKTKLDTHHCKSCNAETEKILSKLRGPGFMEIKI